MNVYVVTLCWLRQGATAIGASRDLEGARAIADRRGPDGPNEPRWGPWYDDMVPTGQPAKQIRHRVRPDGAVDVHEWQEIVVLPLADAAPVLYHEQTTDVIQPSDRIAHAVRRDVMAEIAEVGKVWGAP
jgi:hypothetical protein